MGMINELNYECEITDGVKMEPFLLNKWLIITSMVWQNFSLLFDAIDSENAYVMESKICQACCL